MDWFAARGFDTCCMDNEGYGRSGKHRPINFGIPNGALDLAAGSEYILQLSKHGKLLVYGISSGALKAALFAQQHPDRVERLALDAFVWTGEGSPTLAQRKLKLADFLANNRRPIDRAFVHSIFSRDHPGCADEAAVSAFADAILSLDNSMPTGTYVDMCSKLPLVDPGQVTVPTHLMRGEHDGIASFDDLARLFERLPTAFKQFTVMQGISHASFQQKNYKMVYHILHAFFTQPAPVYRSGRAPLGANPRAQAARPRISQLRGDINATRTCWRTCADFDIWRCGVPARAQGGADDFPSALIRLIVPFAPGGFTDVVARMLAEKLTPDLGQPVVVENRMGAGSTIDADYVAKATPDGYTLALISTTHVIAPWLYKNLPYDALKSFAPITKLVDSPYVLVTNLTVPVKSGGELVALAKAKPGSLDYASSGNGSSQHLAAALRCLRPCRTSSSVTCHTGVPP